MRSMFWVIAIFALAVGVAMLADANSGYMLVVFPPWRAQISLNLAILALLFGFIIIYGLTRVFSRAMDLPGRVGSFRARRRQDKAFRSMRESLQALFEGRFSDSLRQARIAYASGDESPVAALVAARAAHALNDEKSYRQWMARAAEPREGRVAGLLTGAELAIEDGDLASAGKSLKALRDTDHRSTSALRLALDLARAEGRWGDVREVIGQLAGNKAITAEQARPLLRQAHIEELRERVSDPAGQLEHWRVLGKDELADPEFVRQALPLLAAAGQGAVARRVVERLLDANWDGALARNYVLCSGQGEEAGDALAKGERWLVDHPEDAGLLFSLGRQCMAAQIWGKAQSYLEQSLRLQPSADVHLALGDLMTALGRSSEASVHYRDAARLSIVV